MSEGAAGAGCGCAPCVVKGGACQGESTASNSPSTPQGAAAESPANAPARVARVPTESPIPFVPKVSATPALAAADEAKRVLKQVALHKDRKRLAGQAGPLTTCRLGGAGGRIARAAAGADRALEQVALRKSHQAWVAFSGWREHHRVEELVINGEVVRRKEWGSPLVVHPRFGPMPLDDERSVFEDGTTYSREDWDEGDGLTVRRTRRLLVRRAPPPAAPPPPHRTVRDVATSHATLAQLAQDERAFDTLDLLLLAPPPPCRDLAPAFFRRASLRRLGMPDIGGEIAGIARAAWLAERGTSRTRFLAQCRSLGCAGMPLGRPEAMWVRVTGSIGALRKLALDGSVKRALVAHTDYSSDSATAPTTTELCSGGANPYSGTIDVAVPAIPMHGHATVADVHQRRDQRLPLPDRWIQRLGL